MDVALVFVVVIALIALVLYGARALMPGSHRQKPEPARPAPLKRAEPTTADDRGSFDDWVAEMDAKHAKAERAFRRKEQVTEDGIDETLPTIDLRALASQRLRIVGVANYLSERDRGVFGGDEYQLVREPENPHDGNAVAVYGRGRKVGYLSAAKAASLAPHLDRLGEAAFTVGGTSVTETSTRLWVDLPRVPELRAFRG